MKIVKLNYSRSPWRLVTDSGQEVQASVPFEHPDLGWTWIIQSVCGETKAECIDKALELLDLLMRSQRSSAFSAS
jgi:hypothetical protein